MPTVWFIPRGAEYCNHYRALGRYLIGNQCNVVFFWGNEAVLALFVGEKFRKLLWIIGSVLCIKSLHDRMTKKAFWNVSPSQCMQFVTMICSSKCSDSGESIFRCRSGSSDCCMLLDGSISIFCCTTDRTPKKFVETFFTTECVSQEKSKECYHANQRVISDGSCP